MSKLGMFLILLSLSGLVPLAASHHIPAGELEDTASFVYGGRVAVIMDLGDFDFFGELKGFGGDEEIFRGATIGAYYRLHRNLKLGLFYNFQAGLRHDDDWIELGEGDWAWADTFDRWEHGLTADLSPRFLLPFLPGNNWVFTGRLRYSYNFHNNQQKFLFRPDLTWYLIRDRAPVMNISAAYGLYFPLNFGETLLYEHGPYLGLLYHINEIMKLELTGEYAVTTWSTSTDSLDEGSSYLLESDRFRLGLGLVLNPSF